MNYKLFHHWAIKLFGIFGNLAIEIVDIQSQVLTRSIPASLGLGPLQDDQHDGGDDDVNVKDENTENFLVDLLQDDHHDGGDDDGDVKDDNMQNLLVDLLGKLLH